MRVLREMVGGSFCFVGMVVSLCAWVVELVAEVIYDFGEWISED